MFRRTTSRVLLPTVSLLVSMLAFSTGCDTKEPLASDVMAPKAEGESPDLTSQPGDRQGAFFPLQQGNTWEHARHLQVQVFPDGAEPQDPVTVQAQIESQIAGTEVREGLSYAILERRWNEEGDEFTQWIRMRQDKKGLYEADVSITEPPMTGLSVLARGGQGESWNTVRRGLENRILAQGMDPGFSRALDRLQERHARIMALVRGSAQTEGVRFKAHDGGVQPNELLRLAYPLHAKASWTVREDPTGMATVEAREVLDLPAGKMTAWRIRLQWDFLEPGDRVVVWYGRCGMLKLEAHTQSEATDMNGQPIGTLVADEGEVLVDLDVQRGGCR